MPIRSIYDRLKLNSMTLRTRKWQKKQKITRISHINEYIEAGRGCELIRLSELNFIRQLNEISKDIKAAGGRVKLITIAGPSSSGKTTFSYRLKKKLEDEGITAYPLAMDNYFKNREETPRDKSGNYDFERLETLDLTTLDQNLKSLISGKRTYLPGYNFKSGRSIRNAGSLKLADNEIIIMEGIHGLNPHVARTVPEKRRYRIYVTAMPQLRKPDGKYMHTTNNRLIRRIVRDARTRGYTAEETIRRWPSVVRGEHQNIFPHQGRAHFFFNSALLYELPVLKHFAVDLLIEISRKQNAFLEARRMLALLNYFDFLPQTDMELIPKNSVIREFIGGSMFEVN